MDSRAEIFADGMGEITLSGGMVRIDLVSLSPTKQDAEGKPQLEFRQRIVMPPDGFLRSFSAMEDLVKKLVDAGVVKTKEGENQTAPVGNEVPEPPKSPNF
ncbi:MAG: hypothetical protein VX768_16045 [Planctomycetota bacterium]|nr:hypothetical protein [Planctomycetota bacterium]